MLRNSNVKEGYILEVKSAYENQKDGRSNLLCSTAWFYGRFFK